MRTESIRDVHKSFRLVSMEVNFSEGQNYEADASEGFLRNCNFTTSRQSPEILLILLFGENR